jgi:hypothetical protein
MCNLYRAALRWQIRGLVHNDQRLVGELCEVVAMDLPDLEIRPPHRISTQVNLLSVPGDNSFDIFSSSLGSIRPTLLYAEIQFLFAGFVDPDSIGEDRFLCVHPTASVD